MWSTMSPILLIVDAERDEMTPRLEHIGSTCEKPHRGAQRRDVETPRRHLTDTDAHLVRSGGNVR
jgi:hypothetical protein